MSTKFHWNWSTMSKMAALRDSYLLFKNSVRNRARNLCLTRITQFQHLKLIAFKCQYYWNPNYFWSNHSLNFGEIATAMSDSDWLRYKNFVTENCLDKFGKWLFNSGTASMRDVCRTIEHLNTGLQQMSTKQRHGYNVAEMSGHDHQWWSISAYKCQQSVIASNLISLRIQYQYAPGFFWMRWSF